MILSKGLSINVCVHSSLNLTYFMFISLIIGQSGIARILCFFFIEGSYHQCSAHSSLNLIYFMFISLVIGQSGVARILCFFQV